MTERARSFGSVADDDVRYRPGYPDSALGAMRAYLDARPETSAGEFVLPLVTDVLRSLRR